MGFTLHLQHHSDPATERKLNWIIKALQSLIEGHERMALDLTRLRAEISEIGAGKLDAHDKALETMIAREAVTP